MSVSVGAGVRVAVGVSLGAGVSVGVSVGVGVSLGAGVSVGSGVSEGVSVAVGRATTGMFGLPEMRTTSAETQPVPGMPPPTTWYQSPSSLTPTTMTSSSRLSVAITSYSKPGPRRTLPRSERMVANAVRGVAVEVGVSVGVSLGTSVSVGVPVSVAVGTAATFPFPPPPPSASNAITTTTAITASAAAPMTRGLSPPRPGGATGWAARVGGTLPGGVGGAPRSGADGARVGAASSPITVFSSGAGADLGRDGPARSAVTNSSAIASADWKRSSGFLASARRMIASTSGSRSGFARRGGGGASLKCLYIRV